jgi:hypothetical protein
MRIDRYYYISTLPMLGELGSDSPMGLADLMELVGDHKKWRKLVGAVVLLDDLQQREGFLAGELTEVEPSVLTERQAKGEAALPSYLTPDADESEPAIESDLLWGNYFRYAAQVGRDAGSSFLVKWVAFEASLRNALASARAQRLGLEPAGYLIATDLADEEEDLSVVLSEWESATTPLAGLRVVIRARWEWIKRNEGWFTFSTDELLVQAARIMLLEQWRRSTSQGELATA